MSASAPPRHRPVRARVAIAENLAAADCRPRIAHSKAKRVMVTTRTQRPVRGHAAPGAVCFFKSRSYYEQTHQSAPAPRMRAVFPAASRSIHTSMPPVRDAPRQCVAPVSPIAPRNHRLMSNDKDPLRKSPDKKSASLNNNIVWFLLILGVLTFSAVSLLTGRQRREAAIQRPARAGQGGQAKSTARTTIEVTQGTGDKQQTVRYSDPRDIKIGSTKSPARSPSKWPTADPTEEGLLDQPAADEQPLWPNCSKKKASASTTPTAPAPGPRTSRCC